MLGFLSKHGHRRWRRYKKKLVDNGRLSEFLGIQNDAYVNFLKLSGSATAAQVQSGQAHTLAIFPSAVQ